jgi:hypothetical protein
MILLGTAIARVWLITGGSSPSRTTTETTASQPAFTPNRQALLEATACTGTC